MVDPLRSTALELGRAIRRGEVSSEELTRFFLARIARHNSALQAFVDVMPRRALYNARLADKALRHERHGLSPLFGVPCGIKDLVPVLGTFTRFGSAAFRHFVSPFNGEVARRINAAQLIVLGKLATSELGAMPITEPAIHPPTRNPWNLAHTAGGSSGGSGAAVAAGLLPLAHGSDGAGSVRIPAAFCHLYGFKPSRSLLGNLHGPINILGLSVMGPLSHTVTDAAALLDVMSGRHPSDSDDSLLIASEQPCPPMRIGIWDESPLGKQDSLVTQATARVADVLDNLGHRVERLPALHGSVEEFLPLWQQQMSSIPILHEQWLEATTRYLRHGGRALKVGDVRARARMLERRAQASLGQVDMVLTPSVPILPPRVGEFADLGPAEMFEAVAHCGAFTAIFNVSGQPAATIPVGVSDDGLPHGVQLVGKRRGDRDVLRLSRQLEQELPWRQRRAPAYWPVLE